MITAPCFHDLWTAHSCAMAIVACTAASTRTGPHEFFRAWLPLSLTTIEHRIRSNPSAYRPKGCRKDETIMVHPPLPGAFAHDMKCGLRLRLSLGQRFTLSKKYLKLKIFQINLEDTLYHPHCPAPSMALDKAATQRLRAANTTQQIADLRLRLGAPDEATTYQGLC